MKPPPVGTGGEGNWIERQANILLCTYSPNPPPQSNPDQLPLAALRRRTWWRAFCGYPLTPAERYLLVTGGGRDD